MNLLYFFLLIFILPASVLSQQKNFISKDSTEIIELINNAKKFRYRNIDSSLSDANRAMILSEEHEYTTLYNLAKMQIGLILAEKSGEKNLKQSIRYTNQALFAYRQNDDSIMTYECLKNLSVAYKMWKKHDKALDYAYQGLNLAIKLPKNKKRLTIIGSAYGTLGNVYEEIRLLDSALVNYKKAKRYFRETNSTYQYFCANNLGVIYEHLKEYTKALMYYKEAYQGLEKINNISSMTLLSINIGGILIQTEDYEDAIHYFHKSLKLAKENGISHKRAEALYKIAYSYDKLKNRDSSMFYVNQSLKIADSFELMELQSVGYEFKAELLEKQNDLILAFQNYKIAKAFKDSLQERKDMIATNKILLNNLHQKNLMKENQYKTLISKKNVILIIFAFVTSVIIIIALWYRKLTKVELASEKKLKKNLEVQYQETKEKKEMVERKMTTISASMAIKNELLNDINVVLNELKESSGIIKEQNKKIISTQKRIKDQLVLDKQWNNFFLHFEKIHPHFLKKLNNNYKLSQTDIKLCCFIKMGLSNKEICQLLNINLKSIYVIKHRLRKKLGVSPQNKMFFIV